jgi:sugar/nucleoside kinase (ribokinase family)
MSVLVVGSMALDTIRTPFGFLREGLGGSATHFSFSASFFTRVKVVAVVGADFPKRHLDLLRSRGVDLRGLTRAGGRTFRWSGSYEEELNEAKTLKTELNVFMDFQPDLSQDHRRSRFVFLANIDPDLQRRVVDQVENPSLVACDTMNYWIHAKPAALQAILRRVDLLFINEGEARLLAGESNIFRASRTLLSLGPSMVVVKRGTYGSLLFRGRDIFWAPAYPLLRAKDPTGAGDTFAGGFMGYLSRRAELTEARLRRALIYGSIMASFCVEDFSLKRLKRVTPADIQDRYRTLRNLTRF